MKNLTFVLFVSICFCSCQKGEEIETSNSKLSKPVLATLANSWNLKSPVGSPGRYVSTAFSIGNKGYLAMGFYEFGLLKDVWEFNSDTGIWTRKADFPGPALYATFSFVIGNKGYVGGGSVGGIDDKWHTVKEFWEYDPATDIWTKKADYPGKGVLGAVGFSIGGEGFAGTGIKKVLTDIPQDNDDEYQNDFWKYNPGTNTWTKVSNFPGCPRAFSTAFVIDRMAYVGTGTTSYRNINTKDFYKYDPASNLWTRIANFGGNERAYVVSFSINGKGYGGTGRGIPYPVSYGPTEEYKDFWEYNPLTNKWTQKADFAGGNRTSAAGFTIKNKAYLGTGIFEFDGYKNDFWEYSPD